jgi:hypothetical protein
MDQWQNRITEYTTEDPRSLELNPFNYRSHPWQQRAALLEVMRKIGNLDPVKVSRRSRRVIDGEMRVQEAIAHKQTAIPVAWLDLESEQEEAEAIAYYHTIGDMADPDAGRYAETLRTAAIDHHFLRQMTEASTQAALKTAAAAIKKEQQPPPAPAVVPETIYPSGNEYDIPELLLELQAETAEIPIKTYGERRRGAPAQTIHFYTDDYRFSGLWKKPEKILESQPIAVVEPNYTLTDQVPTAEAIYRTYQKRYIARYLQQNGIRIFADLNVDPPHVEINTIGIPAGWQAYATRGYSHAIEELDSRLELATEIAGGRLLRFMVYGGGTAVKQWAADHAQAGVFHISERADRVKGKG